MSVNVKSTPSKHQVTDPHGIVIGQGDFQYRVNMHWNQISSNQLPVENCHDLAFDSQGRIIMVSDHPQNNIIIYNKDGKLIDAWGGQFPGAHSVKVNHENGEDFLYVVDCGWVINRLWTPSNGLDRVVPQAGFIAKLTLTGQLIFTISHPQTIGVYRPDQPFRPTDIAIADNGDIYVTDGYGSDYVLQYDCNGKYIRHWGGHDNSDERLNLANTHGIGIDKRQSVKSVSSDNSQHLIISSRADNTLKQYSLTGDYLDTIDVAGAYIGGPVFHGDHFFAPVCWSHIDGHNADNSGFISVFDINNKVISNLGGTAPEYIDNVLQPMQTTWDVFKHCHGLCIDNDENIYVGQWNAQQTYPIQLIRI
ncbi:MULTISPECIES: 6-bladed beta-propeller [unclassified Shewanella]|uniref:6-bladed beta-propeller n=1 Tax=unclassified Shewanella TaxID=196818 RepID=UPI00354C9D79